MNSLAHANAFFLISTIGFVIIFILIVIGLVYVIMLFKSILRITKKIEKDIDNITDTAKSFIAQLWSSRLFSMIFGRRKKRKTTE